MALVKIRRWARPISEKQIQPDLITHNINNYSKSSDSKDKNTNSRFITEELLGKGGICEVYSALDLRRVEWGDSDPRVALKRIQKKHENNHQAELSLVQEFCLLRHLTHKGIIRVYDLHQEPQGICFTMELLKGLTIYDLITLNPYGIAHRAINFAKQLFEILVYLHNQGIAHGDIKPNNIYIANENRIVLFDFNVSTITNTPGLASISKIKKLNNNIKFKSYNLLYSDPNRLKNMHVSLFDDIFSSCCVVYELASGRHPFNRQTSQFAFESKIEPQRPNGLSRRQWNYLKKGLSFYNKSRPSAEELFYIF